MSKITLNKEEAIALCWEDVEDGIIIEDGEWTQDSKCQYKEVIFNRDGKIYSTGFGRSGSPFTDWNYGWEWDDSYTQEAVEVEKVEQTTYKWVAV